ncbi:hypothetical protein ACSBR1_033653 [Camellia fascicularis]
MPGVTEQRKWLTISVELIANPSIIFMDEPTTRLDARAVAIVMRAVKNVAETGRILVLSMTWISSIVLLFQILTYSIPSWFWHLQKLLQMQIMLQF